MDVKALARGILGQPTDIMTRASLHPASYRRILVTSEVRRQRLELAI